MMKKRRAQSGPTGMRDNASVKTIKAIPGPCVTCRDEGREGRRKIKGTSQSVKFASFRSPQLHILAHIAYRLSCELRSEPNHAEDNDAGKDGGEGVGEGDNECGLDSTAVGPGVAGEGYVCAEGKSE